MICGDALIRTRNLLRSCIKLITVMLFKFYYGFFSSSFMYDGTADFECGGSDYTSRSVFAVD